LAQGTDEMSKVSFTFRYAGEAVDDGLIDVRDLAPALLAIGDLCEQANFQVNGDDSRASVQIRAVAPGSFMVDFYLVVRILGAVRKLFSSEAIRSAREIFDLAKDAIETTRELKGRKVEEVTELTDGSKRLSFEHKHTLDLSPQLYALLSRRPVQDDLDGIVTPLRTEGIDRFEILEEGAVVETVSVEDIASFETLSAVFPTQQEEPPAIIAPSKIQGSFKVVTVSMDARKYWTLLNAGNFYNVKVDDKQLLALAREGHLGIEPGFIITAEIRSEIRFVRGQPKAEHHLVKVISKKPPEPRDDGSNPLPLEP
jgi:hypothetical protein